MDQDSGARVAIDDPYDFLELDETTRRLMLEELDLDIAQNEHPYLGKTLTDQGRADYVALLRQAMLEGDEASLVIALSSAGRVNVVPVDAARRLGRTEFNRYYMRAICVRAAEHDATPVVAYRAHDSKEPRKESDRLIRIGEHSAPRILAILRAATGGDAESGVGQPNSGLSLRCGCSSCLAVT